MVQVPIEKVSPGMRIGLTSVVTKVEPIGPDEFVLEQQRDGFDDLGIPASRTTYSRGDLISIEDRRP